MFLIFCLLDSLFFMEANVDNCEKLLGIVQQFCSVSGQKMNRGKSSLVFSANTPEDFKVQLAEKFQIPVAANPGTYLGIPSL